MSDIKTTNSKENDAANNRPVVKKSPVSIYPEATKRLPGNNNVDNLPDSRSIADMSPQGHVKVYKRVQSLFFYTIAILAFSLISFLTLLANHRGIQFGEMPEALQIFGYIAVVIPVVNSIVFLTSKRITHVAGLLTVLIFSYLSIVIVTAGMMIENFADFFTGIGLVCLLHIGFMLWTRQEIIDVRELR